MINPPIIEKIEGLVFIMYLSALYSGTNATFSFKEKELLVKWINRGEAKNTREKDHQDFITVKDTLDEKQKKWLRNALEIHEPEHNWHKLLI
ncbi:hypothetical protein DVB69_09500 [Sporosarcina sp. BI001-red]|uniref:hypothetical protein n=1 Tax=Sporosarcina sp. BI001-red TaxID=2282866 RepID=UPI000E24E000|nr:hypothetical protein [Sporosarcina sp. BI001-red]REB07084.1 hypothetical protein DVB69_09500 [Sporosarcina sp. BI001-red]